MPGFITHYLFGMKTFHKMDDCSLKNAIRHHPSAFLLGLQGPDLFFFYLPSLIGNDLRNTGSRMHVSKTGSFFERMIQEARLIGEKKAGQRSLAPSDSYDLDTSFAFLAGFFCHYTLDVYCHPYVYGKVVYQPDEPDDPHCSSRHRSLETRIDTFMLQRLKHMEPSDFSRINALPKNRFDESFLSLFLCRCINEVYYPDSRRIRNVHRLTPRTIRNVFFSLRLECRFLDDPSGIKKSVTGFLEHKILKYGLLSSLMSTDHIEDADDELNLSHSVWFSPWEPQKPRYEAFPELMEKSLKANSYTLTVLNEFEEALLNCREDSEDIEEKLLRILGSKSYHSGLDCREP